MKKNYGIIPAQDSRPERDITEEELITKAITIDLTFKERSNTVKIEEIEHLVVLSLGENENEGQFNNFTANANLSVSDGFGVNTDNYALEGSYRINENDICLIKDDIIQITKNF